MCLTFAFSALVGGQVASAQSNTVSLGQVGTTNTIRVDQTGADNLVGAERLFLRLNQLGTDNAVSIDQFGNRNTVGAIDPLKGEPVPSDFEAATGLNQIGDRNALSVWQSTGRTGGWNTIGVILQEAASGYGGPGASNGLTIEQWGAVPAALRGSVSEGASEHFVGQVIQRNRSPDGPVNTASISQSGGGTGIGHRLNGLLQSGSGNTLTLAQIDRGQQVRNLVQSGAAQSARIEQRDGAGNRLDDARQQGTANRLEMRQSGSDNLVAEVFQDNASLRIGSQRLLVGNSASLSIFGDRNGGEAVGGITAFGVLAESVRVLQSAIRQIGDGNTLSYTVGGERGASSDRNLFGFLQDGFSNGLAGVVSGDENQAAISQRGDGNVVDFSQAGDRNTLSVALVGDRNEARLSRSALAALPSGTAPLLRGLTQKGERNTLAADIRGSDNAFAVLQNGTSNMATIVVLGSSNTAAISQAGDGNIAVSTQSGSGNTAIIAQ